MVRRQGDKRWAHTGNTLRRKAARNPVCLSRRNGDGLEAEPLVSKCRSGGETFRLPRVSTGIREFLRSINLEDPELFDIKEEIIHASHDEVYGRPRRVFGSFVDQGTLNRCSSIILLACMPLHLKQYYGLSLHHSSDNLNLKPPKTAG